jgi:hypothetical protein
LGVRHICPAYRTLVLSNKSTLQACFAEIVSLWAHDRVIQYFIANAAQEMLTSRIYQQGSRVEKGTGIGALLIGHGDCLCGGEWIFVNRIGEAF